MLWSECEEQLAASKTGCILQSQAWRTQTCIPPFAPTSTAARELPRSHRPRAHRWSEMAALRSKAESVWGTARGGLGAEGRTRKGGLGERPTQVGAAPSACSA